MPTLREVLAGYEQCNAWEREEQRRELPKLSIEDGLQQFFELQESAHELAPDAERVFFQEKVAHWTAMRVKMQKAAQKMRHA